MMSVMRLNVGGRMYDTTLATLIKYPESFLANIFGASELSEVTKDAEGRYFIDRDGNIFQYILNFLRSGKLSIPENFKEQVALLEEAKYHGLPELIEEIKARFSLNDGQHQGQLTGYLSLSARGTYAFGRDGQADVKFRKLQRIMVSGSVGLLREAFGDQLNETRDTDRGGDRYTTRFFLKHNFLEKAFDQLAKEGFSFVTSSAGGAGYDAGSEETKWNHFASYVFSRF